MQAALQATLPAALQAALPAALHVALAELYIMAAQVSPGFFDISCCSNNSQNHNRQVIDGISVPFREVQFPNGDHPTQPPACLFTICQWNFI
jgi:hypothetical protein